VGTPSRTARAGTGRARVLLVGKGEPDRGGIPTFLEMLRASELSTSYDVDFLNVAHDGVPEGGRLSTGNLRRTAQDALGVFRRAGHADVVHIHSALAPTVTVLRAALLGLAGRLRGSRVVVHAHGGNIDTWLVTPQRRALLRLSMLPAHRVVAVWSAGQQALSRVLGQGRVRLVDNGVDVDRFSRAEPGNDPPRVLYVGLLTPRKGVLDLIEASRILTGRSVPHELWLVGGTPDEGPDAAVPVRAAATGAARMLGTYPPEQMPGLYPQADVFCLPSWWEAMPLSVLEAMACGLPVVASDVGDVSRAVADGETGYVVPSKSPEALADALEPLLTDPARRREMGRAGRARVESRFSSRATARSVAGVFAELGRPPS
jgi:glycosyltransferase involved in cell wall biosynthesis